ncbi:zinc finger protein 32 isoform X2 [Sigmodon hispidus]
MFGFPTATLLDCHGRYAQNVAFFNVMTEAHKYDHSEATGSSSWDFQSSFRREKLEQKSPDSKALQEDSPGVRAVCVSHTYLNDSHHAVLIHYTQGLCHFLLENSVSVSPPFTQAELIESRNDVALLPVVDIKSPYQVCKVCLFLLQSSTCPMGNQLPCKKEGIVMYKLHLRSS